MDGVIVDFEARFLENFRLLFPTDPFIPLSERRTWRPSGQYPSDKCYQVLAHNFYQGVKPIDGAKEALLKMQEIPDVEVYICSSPLRNYFAESCAEKMNWIRENIGPEWQTKLILTEDKTLVFGHLLFDDKHEFVGGMEPFWEQVLVTDWHNHHIDNNGRVRLNSWSPPNEWIEIVDDRLEKWRQRKLSHKPINESTT